ncbi:Protein kinase domain-containing protein [Rhodovastum atsumiense]|uniref:Protein kinase domain-containing protein n=1 Tax=Rhodovastum atsumiense TaxID=504468 RepID=A0A5M6IKN9_9PROT|nr:hypothetical protein [Rhodovastum atsumiense]KAA5608477.1 hypothetical protein F1189_28985 [Rhodovastum atsumiense]CAH2599671.1 Protein kinase domain-containing protein [Rhodovastum atsumiense]
MVKSLPSDTAPAQDLIAGIYAVDFARPLAAAGAGLPAFAATDRSRGAGQVMALQVAPGAPPRADALQALAGWSEGGLLAPLAHGPAMTPGGQPAWFVICSSPPGLPVSAGLRPWSEAELLSCVLRPVASVLAALEARRVTHRAICPDNLFRAGAGETVVLGAGWAAPPASLQPSLFEPPYSAMCLAAGRGEGSIADDVYALGVTLLVLALGRVPLQGLDDTAILRRKLALGSFAALTGEEKLSPVIADLVRGMLAEDPEHRPPPVLLTDPVAARGRRVAARPPRRAQRPLEDGAGAIWDARSLAHAIATAPEAGVRLLCGGAVDRWLRRSFGDSGLAARMDDLVRLRAADAVAGDTHADGLLAMRAVALLDPLAPLCWRGIAIWPDGLGPALAAQAPAEVTDRLLEIVATEAASSWAALRAERCDGAALRLQARQHRMLLRLRGWGGGLPRLRYALNSLLPCASPLLAGRLVVQVTELLLALETVAARPEARGQSPIDRDIAAFLATRQDQRIEGELAELAEGPPARVAIAELRVLADLQWRLGGRSLPRLAAWLAERLGPALDTWRNRARRQERGRALAAAAATGRLGAMLDMLEDGPARLADQRGAEAAEDAVRRIDAELATLVAGSSSRAETARRLGQELALGMATMVITVALVAAVLS